MQEPTTEVAGDLPDVIRLERLRRRMKQADVAELAGVDQPSVSLAENGKAPDRVVMAIAQALGVAS